MAKIYVNGDAQEVNLPLNVSELIKQIPQRKCPTFEYCTGSYALRSCRRTHTRSQQWSAYQSQHQVPSHDVINIVDPSLFRRWLHFDDAAGRGDGIITPKIVFFFVIVVCYIKEKPYLCKEFARTGCTSAI